MTKTELIQARVDARLKAQAEGVLEKLGLNPSEAIRLFYRQIAMHKGLPFDVKIPNVATRRAMRDVEQGRGLTRYGDTDEMFEKLGL